MEVNQVNIRNSSEIIIISGLFEKIESCFLSEIRDNLLKNGHIVHSFDFFSNFKNSETGLHILKAEPLDNLVLKIIQLIESISRNNNKAIIIGHSLGAFVGLLAGNKSSLNIFFDISLHPKDMFSNMEQDGEIYKWQGINEAADSKFILSSKEIADFETISKFTITKTYLIGAKFGGIKQSQKIHGKLEKNSTLIECNCNHDFKGYEKWAAKTVFEVMSKESF